MFLRKIPKANKLQILAAAGRRSVKEKKEKKLCHLNWHGGQMQAVIWQEREPRTSGRLRVRKSMTRKGLG